MLANEGPRFCWHRGLQLQQTYAEVADQIGNVHRVHKVCMQAAQASCSCLTVDIIEVPIDFGEEPWDE